jgi:cytochrome c oxidase subunit 1
MTLGQMEVGLLGMRRRIADYDAALGFEFTHLLITIAGILIAISVITTLINLIVSASRGKPAGNNPWNSRTLEWQVSSPPPLHNFEGEIEVIGDPYAYGLEDAVYARILPATSEPDAKEAEGA